MRIHSAQTFKTHYNRIYLVALFIKAQKGYKLYLVAEIPYDQQQKDLSSKDDDKSICTNSLQQAENEQLEPPF
jgi:hypothetical protein